MLWEQRVTLVTTGEVLWGLVVTRLTPSIVLPGGQKTASTFLAGWLGRHPQLHFARPEYRGFEDPFFQRDGLSNLDREVPEGTVRYGIRCADYLCDPSVPGRVGAHLDSPAVIVSLRHPATRAVSAYFHFMAHGLLPVRPCDKALVEIFTAKDPASLPAAAQSIRTNGMYAEGLQRWYEAVGVDNMRVVLSKELTGPNAEATMGSLLEFLHVDPALLPPKAVIDGDKPQQTIRSHTRLRWRRLRIAGAMVVDHERARTVEVKPADRTFPRQALVRVGDAVDGHVLRPLMGAGTRNASPETMAIVRDFYRDDIERLSRLLGRDMSSWTRDSLVS